MPHLRNRNIAARIRKLAQLWPVVGILGPRQCGKTTLLERLMGFDNKVFLDDFRVRSEAERSPQTFIDRLTPPAMIDEVQKVPALFDAIKFRVDRQQRPGSYFLTGSAAFSSKIGIRESLTGRIGLIHLSPLSLNELHDVEAPDFQLIPSQRPRFTHAQAIRAAEAGGMPMPAVLRDPQQRKMYWDAWIDTTLVRDLPQFFRKSYDPSIAIHLIEKMASILREGELPTLLHFTQRSKRTSARRIRQYLSAMEDIFLVRRVVPHELSTAKEYWIFYDSGLAAHLMGATLGEGVSLSLIRHFLWNEWTVHGESSGNRWKAIYYKSARGHPIDALIDGAPVKIVGSEADISRRLSIEERPVVGAMKKLGTKYGYLVGPVDEPIPPPKSGGIGILPWTAWS